MMTDSHRYQIDEIVTFQPVGQAEQTFTIVRQMPAERGGPQYRLRSATGQERVAEEAHLKSAAPQ